MPQVEWIKFSTSTFEDEKIRLIESMPDGDALIVVWTKLLIQAAKTNDRGLVYLGDFAPFTPSMLSTLFSKKPTVIDLALSTFQQFGMIEIYPDGIIRIVNWEKHQNVDGMEKIRKQNRDRKQRQRDRQRLLPESPEPHKPPEKPPDDGSRDVSRDSHNEVTPSHSTELEVDKDKELLTDYNAHAREEDDSLPFDQDQSPKANEEDQFTEDPALVRLHNHAAAKLGVRDLKSPDLEFLRMLLNQQGIPENIISRGIDYSFAEFEKNKKHELQKISTVKYCQGKIIDLFVIWQEQQAREEQGAEAEGKDFGRNQQRSQRSEDAGLSSHLGYSTSPKI